MADVSEGPQFPIQQPELAATARFSEHFIDLHCAKCVHRNGGASERTRVSKAGAIYFIIHSGKKEYAVASGNLAPVAVWVCFGEAKYSNNDLNHARSVPIEPGDRIAYDPSNHSSPGDRFRVGEREAQGRHSTGKGVSRSITCAHCDQLLGHV